MNESKAETWGALTDAPLDDYMKHRVNAEMVSLILDEAVEKELDGDTDVSTSER